MRIDLSTTVDHGGIVESPRHRHDVIANEDALAALVQRLAAVPAIEHAYIELRGDLGAGKTTLVRHLLRALGVVGRIKSPTYAIVESYRAQRPGQPPFDAWHFDFYRLDDAAEWNDAGLRDIFAAPGLKLAEWPERVAAVAPPADLVVHIAAVDDAAGARRLDLTAHSALGEALLAALEVAAHPPNPSVDP